ncbi:hypothetical protein K443DRAFT_681747 [Laccaria amethystina LaAM-08-1]|uniref:Uncharacterized protein n=1 Tax=Laccaria amethystina LaAM-08-1 TaxID=1095629 RepID=A0A0C9XHP8_9AGAR|nr:hypothetical protein K443DRAFT_681747 [Laccaria amethystina LaAM-08-1]
MARSYGEVFVTRSGGWRKTCSSTKGWHVYHVSVSPPKLAATDASEAKLQLYLPSIRGDSSTFFQDKKVRKRLLKPMKKPKSLKMQKDASPTKDAQSPEKQAGLRLNVSAGHQVSEIRLAME